MVKRKFMRTRQLKPGMKIDQVVVDRMGRNLVSRGAILDEYQIESMIQMGVMSVYIRLGEEDDEEENRLSPEAEKKVEKLREEDPSKVTLSESVKKRVSEGIQYIYSNTESEKLVETTSNIATDLMDAIDKNDAVAVDINALKTSDEYTFKHSVDVATMSMILAKGEGMSRKEVYDIGVTGLLHDLGKTKVPLGILNKPGKLTDEEFGMMKQHSVFGYRLLKEKQDVAPDVMMGVLQHHEKINGRGYPLGANEKQICAYAKILSVADIYDALVTERPYKAAYSQRDAVEMIMSMTMELDMDAMKSFLHSMVLYPVDSIVELSNGERARVVKKNPHYILRPTVVGVKSGKVYDLGNDIKCANIIIK